MLRITVGLLTAAWLLVAASDAPVVPSCALVPGWTQVGPARMHDAENLFEYMNVVDVELEEGGFQGTDRYLGRVCVFRNGRLLGGYAISRDGFDPFR